MCRAGIDTDMENQLVGTVGKERVGCRLREWP